LKEFTVIKLLIGFKRKQGMSIEDFRTHCRDVHTPLLFSIPEAEKIRRFVVSCPIPETTEDEPTFDAMVEVCYDDFKDMEELMQSENFRDTVDPDHAKFIDFSTMVRLVTEDVVVR
jgi:uncharacterized protein (TIGR02118 family)